MTYGELRATLKARVSNEEKVNSKQIRKNIDRLDWGALDSINDRLTALGEKTRINKIDLFGKSVSVGFSSGEEDGYTYIM